MCLSSLSVSSDESDDISPPNDSSSSIEIYSKLFILTFLFYNASIDLVHFELNDDSISGVYHFFLICFCFSKFFLSALPIRGATRRFIPELSSEACVSISGEMIFGKKDDDDNNALVRFAFVG